MRDNIKKQLEAIVEEAEVEGDGNTTNKKINLKNLHQGIKIRIEKKIEMKKTKDGKIVRTKIEKPNIMDVEHMIQKNEPKLEEVDSDEE